MGQALDGGDHGDIIKVDPGRPSASDLFQRISVGPASVSVVAG
jgi:hypothetical protein